MKKKYNYPKKRTYLEMTKNSKHIGNECYYLRKYFKKIFKKSNEHNTNINYIIKENPTNKNLEDKNNIINKNEDSTRLVAGQNLNVAEEKNNKNISIYNSNINNNNIASNIKNINTNMINKEPIPIFFDNDEIKINFNKIKCEEFKYIKSDIF